MGVTLEELCHQVFTDQHHLLSHGDEPFTSILHGGFSSEGEPLVTAPSTPGPGLAVLPAAHAPVLEFMIPKLLRLQANSVLVVGVSELPPSTLALAETNNLAVAVIPAGTFSEVIEESLKYLSLDESALPLDWPTAADRSEPQLLINSMAEIMRATVEATFPDGTTYASARPEQTVDSVTMHEEGFVFTAHFRYGVSRNVRSRCTALFKMALLASIPLVQQQSRASLQHQRHKYELLEAFARTDSPEAVELLALQAAEVGWRVNGWHICIAGQSASAQRARRLFSLVRTPELLASDLVIHAEGFIIILTYPGAEKPNLPAESLFTSGVGISQPRYGAQGLGAAADAAKRHAHFATEAGLSVSVQQHSVSDPLLSRLFDHPETYQLCRRRLAPLLTEGKKELLRTLTVLLDNESNIAASARALHIHRNTVMQRVEAIEKALSVSLDQRTDKMMLRCAILGLSFDPNQ